MEALSAAAPAWSFHPDLRERLDQWCDNLHGLRSVWQTVDDLVAELTQRRRAVSADAWREIVSLCRQHPIMTVIQQDPFTAWAFQKPRGYPGDAVLLDFIYQEQEVRDRMRDVSPIGMALYSHSRQVPSCRAVRHRRDLLAAKIDDVCYTRENARLLSIACGHLREAARSDAIAADRLDSFIALDQDKESLAHVARTYAGKRIDPRAHSIRRILAGELPEGDFDFIYAAGLYDYLAEDVATRLTSTLFEKLRPGGRLLIANFLDTVPDIGYMETYMDWFLILRSRDQFRSLINGVAPERSIFREFEEDTDSVAYIEIERK